MPEPHPCPCCGRMYAPEPDVVWIGKRIKRADRCPRCFLLHCTATRGKPKPSKACLESRPQ